MAITVTLCGFNDLGRYFSFDGSFSLPIFFVLRKKKKKIYQVEI